MLQNRRKKAKMFLHINIERLKHGCFSSFPSFSSDGRIRDEAQRWLLSLGNAQQACILNFSSGYPQECIVCRQQKGKSPHPYFQRSVLLCPRPIIHISMFLKTLHTDVREELCLDVVFCRSVNMSRQTYNHTSTEDDIKASSSQSEAGVFFIN